MDLTPPTGEWSGKRQRALPYGIKSVERLEQFTINNKKKRGPGGLVSNLIFTL